mmetsp:Transcript_7984/g.7476  ORF Transcript_7984/g.7476 Transcript_7984/m.7476 type:complete len:86 (+) Transcript_7984:1047-1304(+)
MNNLHTSVKRMNEIVMHVMSDETTEEYFEKLILSEQNSKDDGFESRIEGYQLGKEKEQQMRIEFEENRDQYGDYEEYLRQERVKV